MQFEDFIRHRMMNMNSHQLFEARLKSLKWMLGCFRDGTIRKRTIVNLIPEKNLLDLLETLEEDERYEDCQVTLDVLKEIYDYKNEE